MKKRVHSASGTSSSLHLAERRIPGKPVACNSGLLWLIHGLVTCCLGYLAFQVQLSTFTFSVPNEELRAPAEKQFASHSTQHRRENSSEPLHVALYYTILYYTILYYTILYYTILYYTILYYTILCYAILCYTVPYRTVPYRTAPHRTAPHRTEPHRTAPHRTAPHRTAPHRTAPDRTGPHRTVPYP